MYALLKTALVLSLVLVILLMPATVAQTADPPHAFKIGVTTGGLWPQPMVDLDSFNTAIGRPADYFLWYQHLDERLDTDIAAGVAARGASLQLAWIATPQTVPDPSLYQLKDFTNGNWDTYLRLWADDLRDFGHPVLFRPFHEMNGDWTYWSGTTNGNVPADFVPAWRHLYDIFVQEGATNVQFVWSPNRDGSVADAINTYNNYYPGDDYVDYVGFSGYNWGTLYTMPQCTWDSSWQTPVQVFGDSYDVMAARTDKPIMISEMASPELGGDKAAWITGLFNQLPSRFPRIVGVTWFNLIHQEACLTGTTDWRVQSSPASQTAFAAGVQYMDGAASSRCATPGLSLGARAAYWANYSDYVSRILTADFSIDNTGGVDAYRMKIPAGSSSNGAELLTTLPVAVGNVSAGTTAHEVLKYRIPPNVNEFVTRLYLSAEDSCGNSYNSPAL